MATVSLRDVAALAGVSVGSVSNVLNRPEAVSADVSQRVLAAIDTLGYVRNDAARQLRAGRSRCIGLVVLDIANPFFSDLVRGAERRAAEEGLTILVGDTEEDAARERVYIDLFAEQRVFGLLVSPLGGTMPRLRAPSESRVSQQSSSTGRRKMISSLLLRSIMWQVDFWLSITFWNSVESVGIAFVGWSAQHSTGERQV